MKKEVKIWLEKSEKDLVTAKYNLQGDQIEAGLFFLQQSAEKALKALYIKKFKSLIKVHDLVLLARKLKAPKEIIELCKKLTPAYQYTRYPDVSPVENIQESASIFLEYCEKIVKWVKKSI
jgi:HEPN domain-containing protein